MKLIKCTELYFLGETLLSVRVGLFCSSRPTCSRSFRCQFFEGSSLYVIGQISLRIRPLWLVPCFGWAAVMSVFKRTTAIGYKSKLMLAKLFQLSYQDKTGAAAFVVLQIIYSVNKLNMLSDCFSRVKVVQSVFLLTLVSLCWHELAWYPDSTVPSGLIKTLDCHTSVLTSLFYLTYSFHCLVAISHINLVRSSYFPGTRLAMHFFLPPSSNTQC